MKKFLWLFMVIALASVLSCGLIGCKGGGDKTVFDRADLLRLDIRTIVTDPAVRPMIPESTLARLGTAESVFLKAKAVYDSGGGGDAEPLELLANSADEIITILDQLALGGKYEQEIAAIRLAVKILRNRLL